MSYTPNSVPPNPKDLPSFLNRELPRIATDTRTVFALTAAQIASPSAAILANLDAVYRLNVSPYTRYTSNGSTLVVQSGGSAGLSSKLQLIDSASTPSTVFVNSSATTGEFVSVGVGSTNSLVNRSSGDTRYARVFYAMPADTVGENGDVGVYLPSGAAGKFIYKTGGVWTEWNVAAPPPAPAPSPPSMPMGSLAATGTARNGPGRYAGFKLTAGSGAVRIYNGPDASYPLVQEVTSPVVGDWNYADGVDTYDSDTWQKMQSGWAVLAGSGQTVDFAFEDFVGSMYSLDTEATELARITAAYTAGTVWFKAKVGSPTGDGSGSSEANAINGLRALSDAINAGSIPQWSRVRFSSGNGAITIASDGADWPSTVAASSGLSQGSARTTGTTNPSGPILGDTMGSTSKASKLWFDFGDGSTTSIDWSGGGVTRRAWAALRLQGEEIVVTGLKVVPPNYSYIIDPSTGATRITGVTNSDAELRSFENHGIIVFGNGGHIHNCHVVGDKTWQRYGILLCVADAGVSNATGGKRGSVSYCTATGTLSGMQVQVFGTGGYILEIPTGCDIHHNEFSAPGWGNSTWLNLSVSGSGNAAGHGNGIGIQGAFFGGVQCYANTITGGYQDGIAAGLATGAVIHDNYIYDLNRTSTRSYWAWTGTAWAVTTVANNTASLAEGNGIKTGLRDKDRISPSTWLGTDGTASTGSDSLFVPELRPIVLRNIIHNVNSSGITSNESNGGFIGYNEIKDPQGAGIVLTGLSKDISLSRQSNWYIAGNMVKKTVTGGSSWGMRFESNTNNTGRVWFYNNILWVGGSQNLLFVGSGITIVANAKNVFPSGTITGTYSTATDLTDSTSKADAQLYVFSSSGSKTSAGLPVGNSLRTAGSVTPQTAARTFGCYLDFRGTALHATTPCVGPCNAP
jgi:hypothetical protein